MPQILKAILGIILIGIVVVAAVSLLRGEERQQTAERGIFSTVGRTDDRGESWFFSATRVDVSDNRNTVLAPREILTITPFPQTSYRTFLLLGTRDEGMYISGDAGKTWLRITGDQQELAGRVTVYDIAIDPIDPNRWYLATLINDLGQVLVTDDGGASFRSTYHTAQANRAVFSVSIDPQRRSRIIAATAEGLLLESTNFGREWKKKQAFRGAVAELRIQPHQPHALFLLEQTQGLLRSLDDGKTFQPVNDGLSRRPRIDTATYRFDPRRSNRILLASSEGLFRSTNNGTSWQSVPIVIPPEALPIQSVIPSHHTTGTLYVAAGFTLYRSSDDGDEWTLRPLPGNAVLEILVEDPHTPGRLYGGIER